MDENKYIDIRRKNVFFSENQSFRSFVLKEESGNKSLEK